MKIFCGKVETCLMYALLWVSRIVINPGGACILNMPFYYNYVVKLITLNHILINQ